MEQTRPPQETPVNERVTIDKPEKDLAIKERVMMVLKDAHRVFSVQEIQVMIEGSEYREVLRALKELESEKKVAEIRSIDDDSVRYDIA